MDEIQRSDQILITGTSICQYKLYILEQDIILYKFVNVDRNRKLLLSKTDSEQLFSLSYLKNNQ